MVKINDEMFISADSSNFILRQKSTIQNKESKNYGETVYKDLGYYSTLEGAVNGILKYYTRDYLSKEDVRTLKDLKKYIEELSRQIEIEYKKEIKK